METQEVNQLLISNAPGRQALIEVAEGVYRSTDTCSVYLLVSGSQAILIDCGDGSILDRAPQAGVSQVTDILMTHHHRDQAQGLPRLVAHGARVWAPQSEQDFFSGVENFWQGRQVLNNYNTRQDRFSLLEPVPLAGVLHDYSVFEQLGYSLEVIPTPGHTPGSISLMVNTNGQRVVFCGDLISAPGKVWSLAATQWTYNGAEGVAMSILSLLDLERRQPDLLLPSHGEPIDNPHEAIDLLVERLLRLLEERGEFTWLMDAVREPFERITPHLLRNRTSIADGYILLSDSGKALAIDYGYDFTAGQAAGTDRAARRPWLYTLPALKSQFDVDQVEVAIPTHYHDDHVAGLTLLHEVENTEIWAADHFAPVLENPTRYDLPCLWYDPIPVTRRLPLGEPVRWHEYELCLYPLAGHTPYAAGVAFVVDGQRVLAVGDQYQEADGLDWNYVYQNGFGMNDYKAGAALYRRLQPQILLSGHWGAIHVQPDYFERIEKNSQVLADLHRELLHPTALWTEEWAGRAWIQPYQVEVAAGQQLRYEAEVGNPFPDTQLVMVRVIVPPGWWVDGEEQALYLEGHTRGKVSFVVIPSGPVSRARLGIDLSIGEHRFGQVAEAFVTVTG